MFTEIMKVQDYKTISGQIRSLKAILLKAGFDTDGVEEIEECLKSGKDFSEKWVQGTDLYILEVVQYESIYLYYNEKHFSVEQTESTWEFTNRVIRENAEQAEILRNNLKLSFEQKNKKRIKKENQEYNEENNNNNNEENNNNNEENNNNNEIQFHNENRKKEEKTGDFAYPLRPT